MKTTDSIPMWQNGMAETWKGPRPFWVSSIRHYLSRTDATVAICVSGSMHPDSHMPGGYKRVYVPVDEFLARPKQCINRALWRCENSIRLRCYGSHIVWAFRNNFEKPFNEKVSAHMKKRGYKVYSPTGTRTHEFLRRVLRLKGVAFSPESLNFLSIRPLTP